mgnify:CR=1 FL=1|tara:strand:- start:491 stop:706 length:216 start_codon:yes stop_codon:yes gene_type:complete
MKNSIQWAVDNLDRQIPKTTYSNTITKHEERRLKYCPECNLVWEISYTGHISRHSNMPTIGLKRITCKVCK